VIVLVALAAGCGGGGGTATTEPTGQAVSGPGFSFRAPEDWTVKVAPTSATASQGEDRLVSVTVLPLLRPYKPALFPRVVEELDRLAATLATRLRGELTSSRSTAAAGGRAREYEIEHAGLVDRITFVLRGKREFELSCRWRKTAGVPGACALLVSSFRFR
jgi:hypothetical protein